MIRKLLFLDPAGSWQVLFEGPRLGFGRDEGKAVVLDEPQIGQRHAMLELRGDEAWIVDLGCAGGVLRNGIPVNGCSMLSNRDVLRIGTSKIRFLEEPEVRRDDGPGNPLDEIRSLH